MKWLFLLLIPMLSFGQVITLKDSTVNELTVRLYKNNKKISTIWMYRTDGAKFELDTDADYDYVELIYTSGGKEVIERRTVIIGAIRDKKKKK